VGHAVSATELTLGHDFPGTFTHKGGIKRYLSGGRSWKALEISESESIGN